MWTGLVALLLASAVVHVALDGLLVLSHAGQDTPVSRGSGQDALWLGHAWVDGRRGEADVTALAAQLAGTGIHDLYVHAGPFNDDGSLDPALDPQAVWLTTALHHALPGVRVQAWLGAHPGEIHLDDAATDARVLDSVAAMLDAGFDGVHYDFEPVPDGDPALLALLRQTHALTQQRGALLSISATHLEPWSGTATRLVHGFWSASYLGQVAALVDQVAVMSYDTAMPTASAYAGYVRQTTVAALAVMPAGVDLFIGVPAYHDRTTKHLAWAETMAAALRGVRLAQDSTGTSIGVALYVDFAATATDWQSYRDDWA